MKTETFIFTSNLTLAAALVIAAGCKTSNYKSAGATAAGLQASVDRIGQEQGRIDTALGALNDLVNTPTNLPVQFSAFSSAVKELESSAKDVDSKVTAMRENGNDYFRGWDEQLAEIKNEDIRNRSLERKNEMQQRFTKIKMSYQEASDTYKPFMSDLKDIRTALSTDLTAGGIASIKNAAQNANDHAVPLKKAVSDLAAEFADLGVALSASVPTPPAQ